MYESPLHLYTTEMQSVIEEDLYKVIQSYQITVDKEELLRALAYDRHQYEKGYQDCVSRVTDYMNNPENYRRCSCCPFRDSFKGKYRFSCGRDNCIVRKDWED